MTNRFTCLLSHHCSIRKFAVVAILLVLGVAKSDSHARADSWSQYQGNSQHTGYVNTSGKPLRTTPTWTFSTNRPDDPTPATSFVPGIASDGRNVFLSWQTSPAAGSGVSAVNINTGKEVWEWMSDDNQNNTRSAPIYDSGRVYVSAPGLVGIDAHNGQQIFQQALTPQSAPRELAAANGRVFATNEYGVARYDGATGNQIWFTNLSGVHPGTVPAINTELIFTVVNGDLKTVGSYSGALATLNHNGDVPYQASSPLIASFNDFYVPAGAQILHYEAGRSTDYFSYTNPSGQYALQGMALKDNRLYVNFQDSLQVLSLGMFINSPWKWIPPELLTSNVVVTNDHLFVGSKSATYSINLSTHSLDWSAPYGGSLAVVGDYLLISDDTAMHAFSFNVPEPASAVLMLPLLAVLGLVHRRRAAAKRIASETVARDA